MTAHPTGSTTSHRERVKAKRREAIRRSAMRLFARFGYDGTTIADIAYAADVAPRTVQQYFPSKREIALSVADEIAGRLAATVEARPGGDFITAVDLWLTQEVELYDEELMELAQAMYEANPSLRALGSSQLSDAVHLFSAARSAQTGLPADHPISLATGAAIGAALAEYLGSVRRFRGAPELHAHFIACLRALLDAARA